MEERDAKTELLVGLFLFVGMLMLGILILQFGTIRDHFKSTYKIILPLADATGIKEGSPVDLGGSPIGKVTEKPVLNQTFNGVIVTLEIHDDKRIPDDAKFGVGTSGLLGDSFIEIKTTGKPPSGYLAPGTVVGEKSLIGPSGISGLSDTAQDLSKKVGKALEDIQAAISDMRTGLKHVNEGILSEKAMKELSDTVTHLHSAMARLDEKTLGEGTTTDLKAAIASIKDASKSFDDQIKRLGPMFDKLDPAIAKVDKVVTDADKAVVSADTAFKSADKAIGTVGDAIKDFRSGQGLLPALLSDPILKNNFELLVYNLRYKGILFYKDIGGEQQQKMLQQQRDARPPLR
jgi:phospholipid/cholesterol/gamma-HCH transport system substrate-binding protein